LEGISQQIYSLPRLTASVPTHELSRSVSKAKPRNNDVVKTSVRGLYTGSSQDETELSPHV
jgi:hypothetical protein